MYIRMCAGMYLYDVPRRIHCSSSNGYHVLYNNIYVPLKTSLILISVVSLIQLLLIQLV